MQDLVIDGPRIPSCSPVLAIQQPIHNPILYRKSLPPQDLRDIDSSVDCYDNMIETGDVICVGSSLGLTKLMLPGRRPSLPNSSGESQWCQVLDLYMDSLQDWSRLDMHLDTLRFH